MSSNLDNQINKIKNCEILAEKEVKEICANIKSILIEEPNVLTLTTPITICGDIHGQFNDLEKLISIGGHPSQTMYLFLGDYVDRGYNSVECLLLLLLYKLRYPDKIFLLRGNHESRQITQIYGFYDECRRKFGGSNAWRYCTDMFDYLPLAAIIHETIFAIHGGLSPSFDKINELKMLDRKQEIPSDGTMCDIMWSDPEEGTGWKKSPRGAGYLFGEDIVDNFNQINGMEIIVRAHQLVYEGYKIMFNNKLVTVWSAPNYCYRCANVAAIMHINDNLEKKYVIFEASEKENKAMTTEKILPEYFL